MAAQSRTGARQLLLQALYQVQMNDPTAAELRTQFAEHPDAGTADMDYFNESIEQILSARDDLDVSISSFGHMTAERLDPVERAVLWLAISELKQRQDIPPKVVINEAVELAKTYGAEGGYRYINGLLDKAAKKLR
jgi:N utilization substance protein B